jgi:hypothetical protein
LIAGHDREAQLVGYGIDVILPAECGRPGWQGCSYRYLSWMVTGRPFVFNTVPIPKV